MKKLLKRAKTFLMVAVSSLILAACATDYPSVRPKLVDYRRQRFLNHELVDRKNVQFRATSWDYDLSKLDKNYCLSASEIGSLNEWAREKQRTSEAETFQ